MALGLALLCGWCLACTAESPPPAESTPALQDLQGRHADPLGDNPDRIRAFVFVRSDCPISNRYAPEIRRICDDYIDRGVLFWLVYPASNDDAPTILKHREEYGYAIPTLRDPGHQLVASTGVSVTPEVAIFAADGTLVYHGRVDDRFVDFGKARAEPRRRELRDALDALLAGELPAVSSAPGVGCFIVEGPGT